VLSGSRLDLTAGSLIPTGNPLDVAVSGSGFFYGAIRARRALHPRWQLHLRPTGQLVTSQGNAVLGEGREQSFCPPAISPSVPDGTISVDGALVDKLRLAEFSPQTDLTAVGNATYIAPAGSALVAADTSVEPGDARRFKRQVRPKAWCS